MLMDVFYLVFSVLLATNQTLLIKPWKWHIIVGYHRKNDLNINLLKDLDLLKVSCFFPFPAIIQQWHVSL